MTPSTTLTPLQQAVLQGLADRPRRLPAWLFYDDRGCELFAQITTLPEYTLTRTERALFQQHGAEMMRSAAGGRNLRVLELGAGTASKTGILLRALLQMQPQATYFPLDVAAGALDEARTTLEATLPGLEVLPLQCNYVEEPIRVSASDSPTHERSLALYIGSSIGNFDPEEAHMLLRKLRAALQPGDMLLLGTDMVKSTADMLAAYDDAAGVTAAFNRNVLVRLNRELAADFDLDTFQHQARWNGEHSRIEMHLCSTQVNSVYLRAIDLRVNFREGESIHTENSYKFTPQALEALLRNAGWQPVQQWCDAADGFRCTLAQAQA